MDIARLPISSHYGAAYPAPPAGAHARGRVPERVTEVAQTDTAEYARQHAQPTEQVIQGEVLERTRAPYSSTHDYLNGRVFENADDGPVAAQTVRADRNSQAVGAYLSHTRELILPNVHRGRQVDYFV